MKCAVFQRSEVLKEQLKAWTPSRKNNAVARKSIHDHPLVGMLAILALDHKLECIWPGAHHIGAFGPFICRDLNVGFLRVHS